MLGRGPRGVVLLHEAPADLCGWAPYGERLARAGFYVLLVDLRGYGLSRRGRQGGPRGAVADVPGAVDELTRLGAKKVVLVGASYGGATALVAAPDLGSRIEAVASLSGELVLGRGSSTELDAIAAVKRLRVPLLVLGSREDRYLNAAEARQLVREAHSTHATLAEFDGTFHAWICSRSRRSGGEPIGSCSPSCARLPSRIPGWHARWSSRCERPAGRTATSRSTSFG